MASNISLNQTIKAIGEIQRDNLWKMSIILNPNSGVSLSSDVSFRVVGFEMPTSEMSMVTESLNNFDISQPSIVKRKGETTVEFIESTDGAVIKFLTDLENATFKMTDTDAVGTSKGWKNLKAEVILWLLNSEGQETQGAKLVDCTLSPNIFGGASASTGDGGAVKPKLKISYNWWHSLHGASK